MKNLTQLLLFTFLIPLSSYCFQLNEEIYYVTAKSGLNYRETSKGKVLGKFSLNTFVEVVKHTAVFEEVKDGAKILKGEWVGVIHRGYGVSFLKETDTVFVFSAYLSETPVQSDIHLFTLIPYDVEKETSVKGTRTAFVNITDSYTWYPYSADFPDDFTHDLPEEKDTISLNKTQRKKFLKGTGIRESQTMYVYGLKSDEVKEYKIIDCPLIVCSDRYVGGRQVGFDLGKNFTEPQEYYVYIGNANPFLTGKMENLLWEAIEPQDIDLDTSFFKNLMSAEVVSHANWYAFSNKEFEFYIAQETNDYPKYRYLVITKAGSKEIVHETLYRSSESTYITPIQLKGDVEFMGNAQYTGQLFKNKPPIIFGFTNELYSCPYFEPIGKREPRVEVLCDNRW